MGRKKITVEGKVPEFFYQIKAKQENPDSEWGKWIWPPVFSGKVSADDRKQARKKIDEEYGQEFPMRVLSKDIESADFLLKISELKPENGRMHALFDIKTCEVCGAGFRVIDHYNNDHQSYKGKDLCSDECHKQLKLERDRVRFNTCSGGRHDPVIYKIENHITSKIYIGQTTQAFTLRWWQHFFHGNGTEFHNAISDSELTDWLFSIVEVVDLSLKKSEQTERDYLFEREQFWIKKFNCIEDGYNTATAQKESPFMPLLEGVSNGA